MFLKTDYRFLREDVFDSDQELSIHQLEKADLWNIVNLTMKFGEIVVDPSGEFISELLVRSSFLRVEGFFEEDRRFTLNIHVAPPEVSLGEGIVSCESKVVRFRFGDMVFWDKKITAWEVRDDLKDMVNSFGEKVVN
ncbi:hypothetical protein ACFL08_04035 [Patescibacteria group bacterium]